MEFDTFDILSAYWLFGSENHGGQFTKEYTYMGRAEKCGFRPGPIFSYDSLTDNGQMIYDNLMMKTRTGDPIEEVDPGALPAGDTPEDYEACGDCQFDHEYETQAAHQWHTDHPGSYDYLAEIPETRKASAPVAPRCGMPTTIP